MKKLMAMLLGVTMILALSVPAMAEEPNAIATNDTVMVDGVTVDIAAYKISGNNYFKLRDLAQAFAGTSGQFDIEFDENEKTVSVTRGKAYTSTGGELSGAAEAPKNVVESEWKLNVDGKPADVAVYNIDGYNYFKLRDIAAAVGFGVGYNEYSRTAFIAADLKAGVTIAADKASATGYNAVFVLDDDGYDSVKITGAFSFAPTLTEDCDFDQDYIPLSDENGMAIKENGKSVVEIGRDVSDEKDNVKADSVAVRDGLLPVVVDAYNWSKTYVYDDPTTEAVENTVTTLNHWSGNVSYDMEKIGSKWVIAIPLPSGSYSYNYSVTTGDTTKTIVDPVNQETSWGLSVPDTSTPGFEDANQGYCQAYATVVETRGSYAYVPFDAEKQVFDWSYLLPVSDKEYEGTVMVDVPYPQRDDIVVPEVAQAYKDGLDPSTGLVDFIRVNDKGEHEGLLSIYLPAGYDPNRATPYKVVYKAHGGRGAQNLDLQTLRIADNIMASEDWKDEDDFLIVTLNCYASATDKAWPSWFDWKVLANITENIIPFMEENFNVGTTEADRAMCGFSGGAAVAHYSLLYYNDWFDYFGIWSTGEASTVPGEPNGYLKYIVSFEQFNDVGLEDEHVLMGVGSYDTAPAGGYDVNGGRDAVQTVRYDHLYRSYVGLRDIVQIEDLEWYNAPAAHDGVSTSADLYKFFSEYLWK